MQVASFTFRPPYRIHAALGRSGAGVSRDVNVKHHGVSAKKRPRHRITTHVVDPVRTISSLDDNLSTAHVELQKIRLKKCGRKWPILSYYPKHLDGLKKTTKSLAC
jgi:hypothetical protein